MRNLVLYVVITSLCVVENAGFLGDSCFTDSGAGVCRPLERCGSLWAAVQQGINRELRIKLQELACGFEGNQPLVCCTDKTTVNQGSGINDRSSTTRTPPTPNTTRTPNTNPTPSTTTAQQNPIRSNNENSDAPPDITGHRNLQLLNHNNCGSIEMDRIIGGNRTRLFEMPWMVLIAYSSPRGVKLSCAGTLITSRYVLTAAHCVSALGSRMTLSGVVLGEYDIRTDPDCERIEGDQFCAANIRNVSIESVLAHPEYSSSKLFNDIALIRLAEPADFALDNMKPICLPISPELQRQSLVEKKATVAGWGTTEDGLQSPVLLRVNLPVISNEECYSIYNGNPRIYAQQLCAGGQKGHDSCGGDSGGPLMFPGSVPRGGVAYVQRGVVSYGSKRCGIGGYPGVYTRVAYYMDWILDNISE